MKQWIPLTLAAAFATSAFALPHSSELVTPMGLGYNIGNTMEVPNDPTGWGNPFPTKHVCDFEYSLGRWLARKPRC